MIDGLIHLTLDDLVVTWNRWSNN